ncbi:MAG TPA: protein phosphatase 2C domain-containing protein [Ktedonobacteraceae bacterium]|jgi:hypothetical protein|nr:protein phosphatase 2C domain-containing protein [Ktedonobacteraceae bacterium]
MLKGFVIGDRGLGSAGDTHPAWTLAYAEADPYLIVGASAIGQIHLAQRKPRDDAFVIRSVGPWLTVAVADGVGTRPLSRYGATYVVESLTSLVLRKLVSPAKAEKNGAAPAPPSAEKFDPQSWTPISTVGKLDVQFPVHRQADLADGPSSGQQRCQFGSIGWLPVSDKKEAQKTTQPLQFKDPLAGIADQADGNDDEDTKDVEAEPNLVNIMRYAFKNTHLGLHVHANSLELELADLSCTALLLLLNVDTGYVAVGQIGDGAVLGMTAQGKVQELVHAPEAGDPQSTYTINHANFDKHLSINVIEPPESNPFIAFYVMSDGLSGDLLYSPQSVEPWSQAVNAHLQGASSPDIAAAGMLNWLSTYQVKGSWDDRTLVVVMQRERSDDDRQSTAGEQESTEPVDDSGSGDTQGR